MASKVHTSLRAAQPAGMKAGEPWWEGGRGTTRSSSRTPVFRGSRTGETYYASRAWGRSRGMHESHCSEQTREGNHREKRPWAYGPGRQE